MVIQVYRPVRNLQDAGSTYNQQRDRMEEDPIHTFDKDLAHLIDTMQEEHYKLIIMGDFNQNIENDRGITKILREKGLKNIMTERHGPGPPVAYTRLTYNRRNIDKQNNRDGKRRSRRRHTNNKRSQINLG